MKKLFALLLAMIMVFALCACSDSDAGEEKTIVGEWTTKIDIADILVQCPGFDTLDEDLQEIVMPKKVMAKLTFEFEEDGTASMTMHGKDAVEKWLDQAADNLTDYMENIVKEQGGSMEAVEDFYGMSLDEYFAELLEEAVEDVADTLDVSSEGEYKLEGDKLYLGSDGRFDKPFVIDFTGDEFEIVSFSGEDAYLELYVGLTFTRK